MKKGQKLSINGTECLLFPMEYMNITQGNNGQFSHMGANALDLAGKDSGIDETIAPCTMKLMYYGDYNSEGNVVFFQSCYPVMFADGTTDYCTLAFVHDNYIDDIVAHANSGGIWEQGEPFGDEGTAGFATGNHTHFEVAKGVYTHPYELNEFGVYHIPRGESADKMCFIDGTIIINDDGMDWKKAPSVMSRDEIDVLSADNMYTLKDGVYRISNQNTKYVIEVPGASKTSGVNVKIYERNGTNAQSWEVTHDDKGYVTFTNVNSGMVLDVNGAIAENGRRVQQYTSNNSYAQKWIVTKEHKILSAINPNYALDLEANQSKNGTRIQLYEVNNSSAQYWHICDDE